MSLVSIFLLVVAAIFLLGVLGEIVFERSGVPDVIWLIAAGMLLGPISGFVDRELLMEVAPYFGALTLVIVLFDGGSELRLKELRNSATRSGLLATLSFLCAVCAISVVAMAAVKVGFLPETWNWLHTTTLGTILGGSSALVLMPSLRNAGLSSKLSNMVNLESALTDVLCVVGTGAMIKIAVSGSSDVGEALVTLGKAFGIGAGYGAATGLIALPVLRRLKRSHYAYPLILGTLLILYVIIDEMQGSAALGILVAAVIIGNAPTLSKMVGLAKTASLGRTVANVHDQMTFIIKSFFFTFIGAMLGPPWGYVAFGVLLGVVLLASRVPAVTLSTLGLGFSRPVRQMVVVSLPRGMAAGVLAMLPHQWGMVDTEHFPALVFAAVITSISIFAAGFPLVKKRLPAEALATGDSKGPANKAREGISQPDASRAPGDSELPHGGESELSSQAVATVVSGATSEPPERT